MNGPVHSLLVKYGFLMVEVMQQNMVVTNFYII